MRDIVDGHPGLDGIYITLSRERTSVLESLYGPYGLKSTEYRCAECQAQ